MTLAPREESTEGWEPEQLLILCWLQTEVQAVSKVLLLHNEHIYPSLLCSDEGLDPSPLCASWLATPPDLTSSLGMPPCSLGWKKSKTLVFLGEYTFSFLSLSHSFKTLRGDAETCLIYLAMWPVLTLVLVTHWTSLLLILVSTANNQHWSWNSFQK